jgi:hypothetical protein
MTAAAIDAEQNAVRIFKHRHLFTFRERRGRTST